jgi:hypothetical protein
MTQERNFKRAVRERMRARELGYAAARAELVEERGGGRLARQHRASADTLLVVPRVSVTTPFDFHDLLPDADDMQALADAVLRAEGHPVDVHTASYVGVAVEAVLTASSNADPDDVVELVEDELFRHLHPLIGADGGGWSFGQAVVADDLEDVLTALPGVGGVRDLCVRIVDVVAQTTGRRLRQVRLPEDCLPYGCLHRVLVSAS